MKLDKAGWNVGSGEGGELDLRASAQVEVREFDRVGVLGVPVVGEELGSFSQV